MVVEFKKNQLGKKEINKSNVIIDFVTCVYFRTSRTFQSPISLSYDY